MSDLRRNVVRLFALGKLPTKRALLHSTSRSDTELMLDLGNRSNAFVAPMVG